MHVSHDEVKRLFGDINDHKIVEIIDSGTTIAELNVDLSRFRSAPGAHLGDFSFESQGAFPA